MLAANDYDDEDEYYCEEPFSNVGVRFFFAGQSNMLGYSHQALQELFFQTIQIVNEKFNEEEEEEDQNKTVKQEKRKKFAKYAKNVKNVKNVKNERRLPESNIVGNNPLKNKKRKKEKKRKRPKQVVDEKKDRIEAKLQSVIGRALEAKEWSTKWEAELMYELAGDSKKGSPLNNETMLVPHPSVYCSNVNPRQLPTGTVCERPVSPIACGADGRNYGPELMFSHVFPTLDTKYKGMPFGITKLSPSGSRISQFMKGSGSVFNYWESMKINIHADNGTIEAFFWFQGEAEHFPETMAKELYLELLTTLVGDVRREIFIAHRKRWGVEGSPTAKFETASDIPVVIVELGPWIGNGVAEGRGEGPGNIIRAQREYVSKIDPNSILVNTGTNDNPKKRLSGYFHFDAPSQLVIGNNMAKAFQQLLNRDTTSRQQKILY